MQSGDTATVQSESSTFVEDNDDTRFRMELEFVQSLANPAFVHCKGGGFEQCVRSVHLLLCPALAQRNYFDDAAFVNYLDYLLYWKQPTYCKFLT